jgi:hypothetical protein
MNFFLESLFSLLSYTFLNTHHADGIFSWLCEWNGLWIFGYYEYGLILSHLNGFWILLFVLTGPLFSKRAMETLVLGKKVQLNYWLIIYFYIRWRRFNYWRNTRIGAQSVSTNRNDQQNLVNEEPDVEDQTDST